MSARRTNLPVPDFYDPENAGRWEFRPEQRTLFERAVEWRQRHDLRPSAQDDAWVQLLLIDEQKDFCLPEGSLYVGGRSGHGAVEDNDRISRFIYRNIGVISEITCTMDTHLPYQIFSPEFWLDETGEPPEPNVEITADDVRSGRFRPDPAVADWLADGDYDWLKRYAVHYCEELERTGRYRLYLWPPHCLLGSEGHTLAGVIHEARLFHAYARVASAPVEIKGETPLTEYYSALGPEVTETFDGEPLAHADTELVETLMGSDAVIIAGQAASHCVKSTVEDLLDRIEPEDAGKVYLLADCMSPVAVPDPEAEGEFLFDFTPEAEAALERFDEAGMHVVRSTDPVEDWLEVDLA